MPASPDLAPPDLAGDIVALIAREGPIGLDRFMGLANDRYYATHDPFGADGDFITAPEISQMFGEIVGLALADAWDRAGRPPCAFVELGPGRGTLAADALRAMAVAGLAPPVHFVETSPLLREMQRARVPEAFWHAATATLPMDVALLIVANEFFDALPIRQYICTVEGWRERRVTPGDGGFVLVPGDRSADNDIPPHLWTADPGSVIERRPEASAIGAALARRLARQGGLLLAIDYGHDGRRGGDTLQAVRAHVYADPMARPGENDLTAHVDFGALAAAGEAGGATVSGPVEQGQWLIALGLSDRAAALARASPDRAEGIAGAYRRLTDAAAMGRLFKVLAMIAPEWPAPAGFA